MVLAGCLLAVQKYDLKPTANKDTQFSLLLRDLVSSGFSPIPTFAALVASDPTDPLATALFIVSWSEFTTKPLKHACIFSYPTLPLIPWHLAFSFYLINISLLNTTPYGFLHKELLAIESLLEVFSNWAHFVTQGLPLWLSSLSLLSINYNALYLNST